MTRKTIKIDENKCIGCALCVSACKESAIELVNGKAKLTREDHCDGLGMCLPVCPVNAIRFEGDEAATQDHIPVNQWPLQIQLVAPNARFFNHAHLLVAADCTAFAYGNFHNDYMKNKVVVIGCPKLDHADYAEKLTEILKQNDIQSMTVARMEVPCCAGIENAAKTALQNCGKPIPWQVVTFSIEGKVLKG